MNQIGYAYAILAAITWGMVYTLDQRLLLDFSPLVLTFIDSIVTAIILAPFVYFNRGTISTQGITKHQVALLIVTILLATAANILIFWGIKKIGASHASVLEISYPFFVIIFSLLIFGEKITLPFVIGSILVFVGSAVIALTH